MVENSEKILRINITKYLKKRKNFGEKNNFGVKCQLVSVLKGTFFFNSLLLFLK